MSSRQTVLVLDYGSQYTQLIARRIRESHVYCEIHPCTIPIEKIRAIDAAARSCSPAARRASTAKTRPASDPALLELGLPVLGICYGEQLMALQLGGKVEASSHREYGPAKLAVDEPIGILAPFNQGRGALGVDEPRRPLSELPPGLPRHRREPERAARRHRRSRPQALRHPVPPRSGAHAARRGAPARVPVRGGGAVAELDPRLVRGRSHRRHPAAASAPTSASSAA